MERDSVHWTIVNAKEKGEDINVLTDYIQGIRNTLKPIKVPGKLLLPFSKTMKV